MKNGKIIGSMFNFPQQPSTDYGNLTFPKDLIHGSRKFYTKIEFVTYNVIQQINNLGGTTAKSYSIPSKSSIKLPIPLKLNDNLILNWSSVSVTDMLAKAGSQLDPSGGILSSGVSLGMTVGGIGLGVALNPLMFLQFQRPEYRTFSLSWVLAPKNEKESETIKNIIKKCKQAASPTKTYGLLMGYPEIAVVQMMPNDIFENLVFKPCVVTSVQVNYNGGAAPSFFKNGAPTIVTLTLNLMEMQFWFRDEIK